MSDKVKLVEHIDKDGSSKTVAPDGSVISSMPPGTFYIVDLPPYTVPAEAFDGMMEEYNNLP